MVWQCALWDCRIRGADIVASLDDARKRKFTMLTSGVAMALQAALRAVMVSLAWGLLDLDLNRYPAIHDVLESAAGAHFPQCAI